MVALEMPPLDTVALRSFRTRKIQLLTVAKVALRSFRTRKTQLFSVAKGASL